jgi:hypothetical protein
MLWFPFWNIRWRGGYDVCHKVKSIFNKNHNNSTHTKQISKPIYIPNFSIIKSVPKQRIELMLCVLVVNLAIPLDTIKQHLPKTFFHLEVGEMIIDETPT